MGQALRTSPLAAPVPAAPVLTAVAADPALLTITERREDGRDYVTVTNASGDHLFAHASVEKAVRVLEEDHGVLSAQCFEDITNAPKLRYRIVRPQEAA